MKSVAEEVEPNPILLSKFRDGNIAHQELEDLLREANLPLLDSEFGALCGDIYCRVDALTELPDLGRANIEFKTMSNSNFNTFLRYGIEAFPGYYAQCQVILGSEPRRPLILWAKNKNTSEYADEFVEPDEDFIDKLKQKKLEFSRDISQDYPPEREFSYNSPECKTCEFRFKCWFATIMRRTLLPNDLSPNEVRVIDKLILKLKRLLPLFREYVNSENILRDYIAMLHAKHSVDRVKLPCITSTSVSQTKEIPNLDYIKSILTDEEYELAFSEVNNKYFRTIINLEEKK